MNRNLKTILSSGYVRRWHANPDLAHTNETLDSHHCRVAQIILGLHPNPSLKLIDAALHHDVGEAIVGDLPQPFKAANPRLAAEHAEIEIVEVLKIGCHAVFDLSEEEEAWLKFADRLAAYLHMMKWNPNLAKDEDWRECLVDINERAFALGVGYKIGELV